MRPIFAMVLLAVPWMLYATEPQMSQQQLYQLLGSMRSSSPEVNFEGIIIYQRDDRNIPARIMRSGNIEKITFFGGYYKQVLHDSSGSTYLHSPSYYYKLPVGNLKDHSRNFNSGTAVSRADMLRYYNLELLGEEKVAGRPVWVIAAVPVDKWRYQHQFCIDKNTKLLLDMIIYDEHINEIERISYAALSFKAPPLQATADNTRSRQMRTAEVESSERQRWGFSVKHMPPGFTPLRRSIKITHDLRRIEQWVITDGLIWVSVFLEDIEDGGNIRKHDDVRVAGINMHTSRLDTSRLDTSRLGGSRLGGSRLGGSRLGASRLDTSKLGGTYVTAVGPVPTITLRDIAKAVHAH